MRGLVLEGGGVKGAYHIGVLKALRENGLDKFDGYVGTSIGAINAAMLAAGDRLLDSKRQGLGRGLAHVLISGSPCSSRMPR